MFRSTTSHARKGAVALVGLALGSACTPVAADAAFAGRNGRIAYTGSQGVYSVRPDGTGRRLLLRNGPPSPDNRFPSYSEAAYAARGARIAFSRSSYEPFAPLGSALLTAVWSARSDGSHPRRLTAAGPFYNAPFPNWAPGGRRLVFYRQHPCGAFDWVDLACPPEVQGSTDYGLFVYRRGRTRLLTHDGARPSWSPNGRVIAFVSQLHELALYVIRPDGSGRRRLFRFHSDRLHVESVDWAPDGRRLLIGYSSESAGRGIATIRPSGRGFRRLSRNGLDPAYSPDGRRIAFVRKDRTDTSRLWVMRADGGRAHRLRLPSGRAIKGDQPNWQPLP